MADLRHDLRIWLPVWHRNLPLDAVANGTLMARRPSAFQAGHIPSWRGSCERYALSPTAAGSDRSLLLLSAAVGRAAAHDAILGLGDGSHDGYGEERQWRCRS